MGKELKKRQALYAFKSVADGKKTHEKVADQIRHAIFEKKIRPGEKLPPERELADMFNTSRVTVRAAILTLKNAGLIYSKIGMGGGTFVADDIGEAELTRLLRDVIGWKKIAIDHVIDVRAIVEPQIAYMAARNAEKHDIENIWSTIKELERIFKAKTKFRGSDENFHRALATAAKNPLLSLFQSSLIDVLFKFLYDVIWQEEHKQSILLHHIKIAEKVQEKDPEAARKAMVDHLSDMRQILSQIPTKKIVKWCKD